MDVTAQLPESYGGCQICMCARVRAWRFCVVGKVVVGEVQAELGFCKCNPVRW